MYHFLWSEEQRRAPINDHIRIRDEQEPLA
jgi:hypothetical protein